MKSKEKSTFCLDYKRDFSLPLLGAWYYGETEGWLKYTGLRAFQSELCYIFENNDGVISSYYDMTIFPKVVPLVIEQHLKDKNWVNKICDKFDNQVKELEVFWKKKKLSSKKDLFTFIDLLRNSFAGLSITYAMPLMEELPEIAKKRAYESRAKSEAYADKSDALLKNTIKELYPEIAGYEKYILIEELKSKKFPSKVELEKRKKHYIYTAKKVFLDKGLQDIANEYNLNIEQEKIEQANEIKGQIAHKGIVKGKVRVILLKEKIKDIKDGEVLVTSMTTPDFLPAMKKAVAFVTDEGGITCHAAIIAREMKKPCIIGTKIATQVLKDGDMVEVDANNGVVKILKRA